MVNEINLGKAGYLDRTFSLYCEVKSNTLRTSADDISASCLHCTLSVIKRGHLSINGLHKNSPTFTMTSHIVTVAEEQFETAMACKIQTAFLVWCIFTFTMLWISIVT